MKGVQPWRASPVARNFSLGRNTQTSPSVWARPSQRISTVREPRRRIRLRSKVMVGRVTCMSFSSAK